MRRERVAKGLKIGFVYLMCATLLFAVQLGLFMNSIVASVMDFTGWMFFITSCVSHAACLALVPFLLLYIPLCLCGQWKWGGVSLITFVSVVSLLLFLDMQVFNIYRFHINGFVLNMVFSPHATDIFTFDTMLYVKEILLFLILIGICIALWWLSLRFFRLCRRRMVVCALGLMIGCTLYAHLYHIYASYIQQPSVIKSQRLLPYYFPTTALGLMYDMGIPMVERTELMEDVGQLQGDINYPLHPLVVSDTLKQRPNIVMVLIDSWNKRALDSVCMPHVWNYAQQHVYYSNHFSCSNGTRSSVFSLFFSLPSYYWDVFESGKVSPLFIKELLRGGWKCQVYPSASLIEPPFYRVVFQDIPNLNVSTEGNTVWHHDRNLTNQFSADMRQHVAHGEPFFSLLFYDLPHSYSLPEEKLKTFTPCWPYADYTKLSNDTDPTEFFNLYRNCCYEVDLMLKDVFTSLEEAGVANNTIVMITGDHGQEFNENKKNYWGHNGNFSKWQIGVPLVCRFAGDRHAAGIRHHRTTHYDLVPTLMQEAIGVSNPTADYSMGHHLENRCGRNWHVVGSELNYAFIVDGDTILEKTPEGGMEVTDAQLNPVENYRIDSKAFREAVERLNSFMK